METEVKEKHIINTTMYAYSCKEIAQCLFMQNLALGINGLKTKLWLSMYLCLNHKKSFKKFKSECRQF